MSNLDRPQLRPGLAAAQDEDNPRFIVLWDQLRLSNQLERISFAEFGWVKLFDGEHSLRDIQLEAMRQAQGAIVPLERFTRLAERLDQALFLEGPRYRQRLDAPIREPSCLGCYSADPDELRQDLRGLFTHSSGPGLPREVRADRKLRAALIPHIDYARGGLTYAWGFKEVFEQTDATLFVIVGTSHYSGHRFTLTRKNFKTPLGIVPTDQAYIDRLVAHYGAGLFDDEIAHLPEHSIELEVVFLQYLYERRRDLRIVPLVVGSFQDAVDSKCCPGSLEDIGRMVAALRAVEREVTEPICYIISGDLAHIGPKFGDPGRVESSQLAQSRQRDQAILDKAKTARAKDYFQVIADEGDARRICGLPPTYTVLEACEPARGKMLHYDQYAHPKGFESVSFASMAFYQ